MPRRFWRRISGRLSLLLEQSHLPKQVLKNRPAFRSQLIHGLEALEPRLVLDSTVVFNELMYHPVGDEGPEWIELHNQMAIDMDLSGWSIGDGVEFDFPEGTIVPGGGYLVISEDPSAMSAGTLGPYTGQLSNSGERVALLDNNDRVMNEVNYRDNGQWPVGPDGSGATLAKFDQNTASRLAANWSTSAQVGGTPGAINFSSLENIVVSTTLLEIDTTWRFEDSGTNLGTTWREIGFDDSTWPLGDGLFFDEDGTLPAPKNTPLTPGQTTYYFRTTFDFNGNSETVGLKIDPIVDDGAVFYLNGQELHRQNMPEGVVTYDTLAESSVSDADFSGPLSAPTDALIVGTNVLAVEVHQAATGVGYSQTVLASEPVAYLRLGESNTRPGGALDSANAAGPPQQGSQNGTYTDFAGGDLDQPGPRSSDAVGRQLLLGFEADNSAPDFQGNLGGGNDVVIIPDDGNLDFSTGGAVTIEAWVKGSTGQENGAAIVAKGLGGGGEQFAIDMINDRFRFFVRNGGGGATVLQTAVATDNTWQHVVATLDVNQQLMKFYLNGQEVGSATPPPTLLTTGHEVTIGARKNTNSSNYGLNFNGRIDEVAIYDRSLSAADVQAHFDAAFVTAGLPGVDTEDVVFGAELVLEEIVIESEVPQLRFNEVASTTKAEFWLEITSTGSQPVDLEGFVLARDNDSGRADYVFPSQTIEPGQFLSLTEVALGFDAADGDRLFLYPPNGNSVLDAVAADDSLRGRAPDGQGSWLLASLPTPGAPNRFQFHDEIVINEILYHQRPLAATPSIPATFSTDTLLEVNQAWRYNQTGDDLGADWFTSTHPVDDVDWFSGTGLLGLESNSAALPDLIRTPLTIAGDKTTYYFETEFTFDGDLATVQLQLQPVVDDGAIFYLNGQEVHRLNMPGGPVAANTFASTGVVDAAFSGPVTIPKNALVVGTNVLSVEVHQASPRSSDVVFGAKLLAAIELTPGIPGEPFRESPEEWIELFNRGTSAVDLSGWELDDAVRFEFAPGTILGAGEYLVVAKDALAMAATYPEITIAGSFTRSLSNKGERILLIDAVGNPADEVHYFDGGRWPIAADGGASLELRDPRSDNARGESWQASDEAANSEWQTYTYRGIATNRLPGAPTLWREFALGMLDGPGEVLLDDIQVIEDPAGEASDLIQNGSFDTENSDHWRLLGNHQRSAVIEDPQNPGNWVLRVVSSGASEYQGNQIETTFAGRARIVVGREYEISFRARHLAGSNQLNTRLYFDILAQTTLLEVPEKTGTPGAVNSRFVENAGPDYDALIHGPAVPEPGEPIIVSVTATDPDGVSAMTLWYSVAGGAWNTARMIEGHSGRYTGTIPGQGAATIVQFYVEGKDTAGAMSTFPRDGVDSRALIKVNDSQATAGQAHNFRIVMTTVDSNLMHLSTNTTSNERLGATIIYNEQEIFYDVGVRLKGSFVGRDVGRVGFNVRFNPDDLFRGVHEKVSVDRSQTATAISPTEVLLKQIANHAGNIPSMYDDIIHVIAPRSAQTSSAHLRMAGFDDVYLDSQFKNGSDGNVYEFEVIRWATNTVDGNVESIKRSAQSGNGFANIDIQDLGDNKEDYRWIFLLTNNRTRDDYRDLIPFAKSFSLTGSELDAATAQVMDVDQWMRAFALQSLGGVGDAYTRGAHHNLRVYTRPEDGKVLALPWDWDNVFGNSSAPLIGGSNLAKIINRPQNKRLFYGHLQDIISTTFNTSYMEQWTTNYGKVADRNYDWVLSYIGRRATFVTNRLASVAPKVSFSVITNGGADFEVDNVVTTIEGNGWIDVREIRLAGSDTPLDVTWTDQDNWRVILPLTFGENVLALEAYGHQGELVGSDTITVTSTISDRPQLDFLRISELMFNPASQSAEELAATPGGNVVFGNDQYEYVELVNTGDVPVPLFAAQFTDGINFVFDVAEADLLPGERIVVARNGDAFANRYGDSTRLAIGQYGDLIDSQNDSAFANSGETVVLADAVGAEIHHFTYDDAWYKETDGDGFSLVVVDPAGDYDLSANWRSSALIGGSPGDQDAPPLAGDFDGDGNVNAADFRLLVSNFGRVLDAHRGRGDINGDGNVNLMDLGGLQNRFGETLGGSPVSSAPSFQASITDPMLVKDSPRIETEPIHKPTVVWSDAELVDVLFGASDREDVELSGVHVDETGLVEATLARSRRSLRRWAIRMNELQQDLLISNPLQTSELPRE